MSISQTEKLITSKNNKYWGKSPNEWVPKTDMNIDNNKINNCSKQMSILTKTKLLITEQKTNADNT